MKNSLKKNHYCLYSHVRQWISVLLVLCIFPIALHAQNRGITLDLKDVTLENAVTQIASQAKISVAYSKEFVDTKQLVSISVKNATLKDALNSLLRKTNVGYSISGGKLLLFDKKTENKVAPEKRVKIHGQVIDQITADPMIGVSVFVKGGKEGTITDIDGNYSIEVDPEKTLVFSFIGYKTQEIEIGSKTEISVRMTENTEVLNDVVVIGYGIQKKVNLTGAVSAVKGDELSSRPITNVGSGLQGMLPGVSIVQPSGQPGNDKMSIVVRGISTLNSKTDPLILIDGIAGGDLNLLNPDDIESVSVLKDAASSAIYGARAANGVILVTTKQGNQKEKTTVSYSGYVGFQTPTALPDLVNGREYMELANEAYIAAGFGKLYQDEAFEAYDRGDSPNDYSNTDWVKEVYKKSAMQTGHNISVRGGTEKSGYYMSYGYLDQDGLIVGDPFSSKRHNARLSMNTELYDRLKINGNISFVDFYRQENGVSGTTGVFRTVQRVSPLLPVKWKEQNEKGEWVDTDHYAYTSLMNPVDVAYNSGYNKRNSRTFNGQVNASLKIIEGLYINGQYAANYYTRDTKRYVPAMNRWMSDGTEDPGNKLRKNSISESHINTLTQTLNATATYQKNISQHDFKLLGGFSQEWAHTNTLSAGRKVLLLDGIEVIDAGTDEITNGGGAEEWALRSFFGRINYNYDEKYLLEANVRYDGTSRFAKDNRWGCFPSFSAGWNFSKEKFMSFTDPILQMAKLRASWGELGNQNVGDNFYPYLVAIESVDKAYPIGNQLNTGFQQIALGNKNIKWETIRMLNIGVDFALFNNRLTISADWFKKNNMDALVRPSFPLVIGKWQKDSSRDYLPLENLGEVESRGWEINLAWRDQIGQVKYRAFFNLSDARNKIIDLGSSAPVLGDQIRRVGDPIDAYYGYRTDGLAQVDDFEGKDSFGNYVNPKFPVIQDGVAVQPGDIKYKDISGPDGKPDGIIDDYDKEIIGDKTPRYSYSFKGELEWKGIDFSFYFQGVGKANGYLSEEARHCFINDYSVPKKSHLDRWTPENPNASYPRMYYAQTHNRRFSDFWIENAAYLRLKNVQLGYTFPQKWMRKFGVSRLRAYVSADNLFTVTKYFDGFDPEVQQSSGDTYPQVRTYVFGLNLTF